MLNETESPVRSFAILPAAGTSSRMGQQHKLLLDWFGVPVIQHVLKTWLKSRVDHVVLVTRGDASELRRQCSPDPRLAVFDTRKSPEDMKASIRFGIEYLATYFAPRPHDRWLVAPADLPTLSTEIIDAVVEAGRWSDRVVLPQFRRERPGPSDSTPFRTGHPVSFSWSLHSQVAELPADAGLKHLVDASRQQIVPLHHLPYPPDMDTPEDYASLLRQQPEN